MSKESIFQNVKEEMLNLIEQVEFGNLEETNEKIGKCFEFLKLLSDLPIELKDNDKKELSIRSLNVVKEEDEEIESENDEALNGYIFRRGVYGGNLEEKGVFVPESIIKDMNLQEGDLVMAEEDGELFNGRKRYSFDLVKKGPGIEPEDRVQIDYCIVKYGDGGTVYVEKTATGEAIEVNGEPYCFYLRQSDVENMNIQMGDIISIAFINTNPDSTVRVVWKHHIESIPYDTPIPISKSHNKEKCSHQSYEKGISEFEHSDLLNGKHILVVGGPDRTKEYTRFLQMYGATVEHIDEASVHLATVKSKVRKADVVVTVVMLRHSKVDRIFDVCKSLNKPHMTTDKGAMLSVARAAAIALGRQVELKVSGE